MAEWSIAAVLKTVEVNSLPGFESLSLRKNEDVSHGVSPWLTSSYFCKGPCGEQIGNAQASAEHNPWKGMRSAASIIPERQRIMPI